MKRWAPMFVALAVAAGAASAGGGLGGGGFSGFPAVSVTDAVISPASVNTGFIDAGTALVANGLRVAAGNFVMNAASTTGIDFTDANGNNRITWGTGRYVSWTGGGRMAFTGGTDGIYVNNIALASEHIADSATAPTVTACSGTAASITLSNGTASVLFDVGTSCAGESTAVLTLPAATNGWLCTGCTSTTADRMIQQKVLPPADTTHVTLQNIVISTGANGDFTDGADVACMCRGI